MTKAIKTATNPPCINLTTFAIKKDNSKVAKKISIIKAIINGVFFFNK